MSLSDMSPVDTAIASVVASANSLVAASNYFFGDSGADRMRVTPGGVTECARDALVVVAQTSHCFTMSDLVRVLHCVARLQSDLDFEHVAVSLMVSLLPRLMVDTQDEDTDACVRMLLQFGGPNTRYPDNSVLSRIRREATLS
ncbi:hypothetical protein FOA52_005435 [Chlamydomonas sp. UWO 241]|nr:hypothetical protein FOA52_005435 [Chlamydomonas sp. UWO 241]